MRLLLLLSALLTALTGAIGTHAAAARPVEASALVAVGGDTRAAAAAVMPASVSPGAWPARALADIARPMVMSRRVALYANRLRV